MLRKWNFENGISVVECDFDFDLYCFEVYNGEKYLGTIYPDSIESMKSCIADLENGKDPITNGWEDGCGNACTLDGWGDM